MKKWSIALNLALVAAMLLTPIAFADEEEPVEIEFTGRVTAIDTLGGTLTVETDDAEVFIVLPPEGFDLSLVALGDLYEVEGTLGEDGIVLASKLKFEDDDADEAESEEQDEEDQEDKGLSFFCRPEAQKDHPFAAALAETYGTETSEIMGWFCDGGHGFGQIMLALQTASRMGVDAGELLTRRSAGDGWGKIWVEMGLIGKDREAHPPGPPEHAKNPKDTGRPDHTGRPEEKGLPPGQDR